EHVMSASFLLGGRIHHGPAAQCEHTVVTTQSPQHGGMFLSAEVLLALVEENIGDGPGLSGLDIGIGVPVGHLPELRQQAAHRGFTRSRWADEDQPGAAHRMVSSMAARYSVMFRATSVTESPPVFSSKAWASTSATIASAMTAAGAIAHTSER